MKLFPLEYDINWPNFINRLTLHLTFFITMYFLFFLWHLVTPWNLKHVQHASSNLVYHRHIYFVLHSFIFSKKVIHWELLDLVLFHTYNHHSSKALIRWSWYGFIQIEVMYLGTIRERLRCREVEGVNKILRMDG